jgi:hypothetical protein
LVDDLADAERGAKALVAENKLSNNSGYFMVPMIVVERNYTHYPWFHGFGLFLMHGRHRSSDRIGGLYKKRGRSRHLLLPGDAQTAFDIQREVRNRLTA